MQEIPVTVVLACGCRRYYTGACPFYTGACPFSTGACPFSTVQKICDMHGDIYDVVWIERVPYG